MNLNHVVWTQFQTFIQLIKLIKGEVSIRKKTKTNQGGKDIDTALQQTFPSMKEF